MLQKLNVRKSTEVALEGQIHHTSQFTLFSSFLTSSNNSSLQGKA